MFDEIKKEISSNKETIDEIKADMRKLVDYFEKTEIVYVPMPVDDVKEYRTTTELVKLKFEQIQNNRNKFRDKINELEKIVEDADSLEDLAEALLKKLMKH